MIVLAMLLTAAAFAADAPPPAGAAKPDHGAEIKLFASTMAIAQVASDYPDFLVSLPMLATLQAHLHIGIADVVALGDERRAAMAILTDGINAAPSPQAWCDAVYRRYRAFERVGLADAFFSTIVLGCKITVGAALGLLLFGCVWFIAALLRA